MPNWCEVTLTIRGPKKDLDVLEADRFDFMKIIPMPEPLRLDMISSENGICGNCKGVMVKHAYNFVCEVCQVEANIGGKVERNRTPEETKIFKQWAKKYGTGSWYDWANKNWGVKWNRNLVSVDRKPKYLLFQFDTPWGLPLPVFHEISKQYPECVFEVEYDIELGNGAGIIIYKKGKDVEYQNLNQENWTAYDCRRSMEEHQ